jgi:hypothetical protein
MIRRKALDRQAGRVPDIRAEGDSVVFRLNIDSVRQGTRLVLRCDGEGNVWAALASAESGGGAPPEMAP